MLREENFTPEKTYTMDSQMVTPQNAAELYAKNGS